MQRAARGHLDRGAASCSSRRHFNGSSATTPAVYCGRTNVLHIFPVLANCRKRLAAILRELRGCPPHGTPFTADLGGGGLVSWGVDPGAGAGDFRWLEGESWRSLICNRLAARSCCAKASAATGDFAGTVRAGAATARRHRYDHMGADCRLGVDVSVGNNGRFRIAGGRVTPTRSQLAAELAESIQTGDGDYALSRVNARAETKVLSREAAALVELFREPTTMRARSHALVAESPRTPRDCSNKRCPFAGTDRRGAAGKGRLA